VRNAKWPPAVCSQTFPAAMALSDIRFTAGQK
jgi:hypothetical protein